MWWNFTSLVVFTVCINVALFVERSPRLGTNTHWPFVLKDIDVKSYLQRKNEVSKIEEDNLIVNERNLLANMLCEKDILIGDSVAICSKHRSS